MLFDLHHLYRDEASPHPPCCMAGMTVDLPAVLPQGILIRPNMVRWPTFHDGDIVVCGHCNRYFGECLNTDCARPHVCIPLQRPDGAYICRAGCDGGK